MYAAFPINFYEKAGGGTFSFLPDQELTAAGFLYRMATGCKTVTLSFATSHVWEALTGREGHSWVSIKLADSLF